MNQLLIEKDGYIDQQNKCSFSLGNFLSSYNGCGWIALYNYMQFFQNNLNPTFSNFANFNFAKEICNSFNFIIKFKGKFGITPWQMQKIAKKYGYFLKMDIRFTNTIYSPSQKGIIFYWTGKTGHYVMYEYHNNICTFHNINNTREQCSYYNFIKKYSKCQFYIHFRE